MCGLLGIYLILCSFILRCSIKFLFIPHCLFTRYLLGVKNINYTQYEFRFTLQLCTSYLRLSSYAKFFFNNMLEKYFELYSIFL